MSPDPGAAGDPPEAPAPDAAAEPPHVERRRPGRGLRTAAFMLVLAAVAFGTGVLLFNAFVMPRFVHSGAEVPVPDVTNLTELQAERRLAAVGLQLGRAGERFDPAVPPGYVLSQDPAPDTPVRGSPRVLVMMSLGEESGVVPALDGESVRAATLVLTRVGLSVGGITHAPSDAVGIGLVAGSDPAAEAVLPRNTPVSLLVSNGSGDESWVMPELLGRDLETTRRALELFGLHVIVPPAAGAHGLVLFQNPPVGARLTRGDRITLRGSK